MTFDSKLIASFTADENCILEILVSLESMDLRYVRSIFQEKYNHNLADFLSSGLKGDMKHLVETLLSKERDFYVGIDVDQANVDARRLFQEGLTKTWGAEDFFLTLFVTRSKLQLRHTMTVYQKISGQTIEDAIKSEFGGSIRHALLALVECIASRSSFFATQLHHSLKKSKTDDSAIIRILVSRSEVDLADICEWYNLKYDKDLREEIYADASGDYRKILLKLLNP